MRTSALNFPNTTLKAIFVLLASFLPLNCFVAAQCEEGTFEFTMSGEVGIGSSGGWFFNDVPLPAGTPFSVTCFIDSQSQDLHSSPNHGYFNAIELRLSIPSMGINDVETADPYQVWFVQSTINRRVHFRPTTDSGIWFITGWPIDNEVFDDPNVLSLLNEPLPTPGVVRAGSFVGSSNVIELPNGHTFSSSGTQGIENGAFDQLADYSDLRDPQMCLRWSGSVGSGVAFGIDGQNWGNDGWVLNGETLPIGTEIQFEYCIDLDAHDQSSLSYLGRYSGGELNVSIPSKGISRVPTVDSFFLEIFDSPFPGNPFDIVELVSSNTTLSGRWANGSNPWQSVNSLHAFPSPIPAVGDIISSGNFQLTLDNHNNDVLTTNGPELLDQVIFDQQLRTFWTNSEGGSFSDCDNWSSGFPGTERDAVIDFFVPNDITLDQSVSLPSFTVYGNSGGHVYSRGHALSMQELTVDDISALFLYEGDLSIGGPVVSDGINADRVNLYDNGVVWVWDGRTTIGSGGNITSDRGDLHTSCLTVQANVEVKLKPSQLISVDDTSTIEQGGSVCLEGGEFIFGTISLSEYGRIVGTAGRLRGGVVNSTEIETSELSTITDNDFDIGLVEFHNAGTVTGSGDLAIAIYNQAQGNVEIGAGDYVNFDGATSRNAGVISNMNGILDIPDLLNELGGQISGTGQFFFGSRFENEGSLLLDGTQNNIFGDVINRRLTMDSQDGLIATNGTTTFFDNMENEGEIQTSVGSTTLFLGDVIGGGIYSDLGTCVMYGGFSPGNGVATVEFEGDLVLGPFNNTEFEIGVGVNDKIIVDGDLTITGTMSVSMSDGGIIEAGQAITVAEIGGGRLGSFIGLPEGSQVPGTDLMITYEGGDGNDIVLYAQPEMLLGDVNQDGNVNLLDVDPFIEVISASAYLVEADTNQDGVVNLLDVDFFIEILGNQ